MLALLGLERRHVRATGVFLLLFSFVVLGGAASHVVQRGETLGEIALEHGVTVRELVTANGIKNADLILIGQVLEIPGGEADATPPAIADDGSHTVARGEVLSGIAVDYGVSIRDIVAANDLSNPDLIRPGQILLIPGAGTAGGTAPLHHVVQRGDTLASVAARYRIAVEDLAEANGMTIKTVLTIGAQLRLTPAEPYEPKGLGTVAYVVKKGDRVGDIAFEHGTTTAEVVRINSLGDPDLIRPGQVLEVPSRTWVCPVPDSVFINDWGFPRSGGRFHQGNDLFARRGTPVYAPVSGVVTQVVGNIGGLQFTLEGDDGHTYYGTHLDSFGADGRVAAGEQLGTVGDTGNARGGKPHLHFEIYPNGVEPVNPYPTLKAACG